jgi:hypothetical protein
MRFLYSRYGCPLFFAVMLCPLFSGAQVGGRGVYSFLNLQPSPRFAALGGAPVPVADADPNAGFYLPALLDKEMDRHLALNYVNYFSDINIGQVSFVRNVDAASTFSAGLLYTNYGKFTATDAGGNEQGNFYASDYAFQTGYGRHKNNWSYGANLKFIFSQLETYKSTGLSVDLNGAYTSDSGRFVTSLLVRNAGAQITTYAQVRERLPFEIQWAFSKKLKHAPLRLIAVVHNLQTWDISYINTNDRSRTLSFGDAEEDRKVSFGDKAFRHVILASELVFSPNFMIQVGYNHQRRREMVWEEAKRLAGFSWGVSIRISKLRFNYSNASFFPGRSSHQFAVSLNLHDFKKP